MSYRVLRGSLGAQQGDHRMVARIGGLATSQRPVQQFVVRLVQQLVEEVPLPLVETVEMALEECLQDEVELKQAAAAAPAYAIELGHGIRLKPCA